MTAWRRRWIGACLMLICCAVGITDYPAAGNSTSLVTTADIPWAAPTAIALQSTGAVTNPELQSTNNCTWLSYRITYDIGKTMQQGCFVPTAFGFYDPSKNLVIFNGTDEAVKVRFSGGVTALSPLPFSAAVARLGGPSSLSSGSYMYLYDHFPAHLSDQYTINPITHYKQLDGNHDTLITRPNGEPLVVNGGALAYAPRGQWMVTESPTHSLVRVNLATMHILPFSPSFYVSGKPYARHKANMAITENGRYVAVVNNETGYFRVYDLNNCTGGSTWDDLAPKNCTKYNYWNDIANQLSSSSYHIGNVRFITDTLLAFDITTPDGSASYMLSPSGPITSLLPYMGLGDSFASGQGAWNYMPGTDTSVNKCHLSVHSYPLLLNRDLFSSAGHSLACSGARITDITSTGNAYQGQASDNKNTGQRLTDGSANTILHDFTPGYLAQETFVTKYRPNVITVQIGGNDIGFGSILLSCISPLTSVWPPVINSPNCYSSYEDRQEVIQTINRNFNRWVQLYQRLQKTSPQSHVYAIGYPHIVAGTSSCSLNVPLSSGDISFARNITMHLNNVIEKAATAAGIHYIDISNALAGHQLCEGTSELAVNGITAGNDTLGVLGQESFHPNALGHRLIEQTILEQSHNFSLARKTPDAAQTPPQLDANHSLLQAPVTGRLIRKILPKTTIANPAAGRGQVLTITVNGLENGLVAHETYTISLGNTVLGTVTTNTSGDIQEDVSVPSTIPSGLQELTVTGTDLSNEQTTITAPIYIDDSPDDFDNDGHPNATDSCLRIPNANIDTDQDGIDDVCDTVITPPANSQQGGHPHPNDPTKDLQSKPILVQAAPTDLGILSSTTSLPVSRSSRAPRPVRLTINGTREFTAAPSSTNTVSLPILSKNKQPLPQFLWYWWLGLVVVLGCLSYWSGRRAHGLSAQKS